MTDIAFIHQMVSLSLEAVQRKSWAKKHIRAVEEQILRSIMVNAHDRSDSERWNSRYMHGLFMRASSTNYPASLSRSVSIFFFNTASYHNNIYLN